MKHDDLCEWQPDEAQRDGSIIGYFCSCDAVARGRLDGARRALAAVDLGGRAAAQILALIEELEA